MVYNGKEDLDRPRKVEVLRIKTGQRGSDRRP